jgi:hypothetical protein
VRGAADTDARLGGWSSAKDKTMIPAGPHREPDGAQAAPVERDASMYTNSEPGNETGVPGSDWSGKADGGAPAAWTMKRLHDAVCPAIREKKFRRTYAVKNVGDVMPAEQFEGAATAAINDGNLNAASYFLDLAQNAAAIKRIDRATLMDARKAYPALFPAQFQDGIGDHPAMHADVDPGMFTRGYVSAGHAPLSAAGASGASGLPGAPVHHVSASDFDRGFIGAGHSSMSPSGGMQAAAGTAAMGQAMTSMRRIHQQVTQAWPELCPLGVEDRHYDQDEGATGIRPSPSASFPPAPGEIRKGGEPELRRILAKRDQRVRELEEEVAHLGALPDPEQEPYRGVPELNGPVGRKSYIDKAASGADPDDDSDDYLRFVGSFANGGDPTMRQNARKVLKGLLSAPGKEG